MHEIQFASKILKEAKKAGAKSFVKVEVGELVEITPEELELGLKKISQGSLDYEESHEHEEHHSHDHTHKFDEEELKELHEGCREWKFEVVFVKSKVKCPCGYEGQAGIVDRGHGYCIFNCPECGKKPDVLEGGEIKIIQIE